MSDQRIFRRTLTVPSTASTTTVGTQFAVPVHYDSMLVVGELVGLTGGTLDVYLQDSPDDGTTWIDCAHFTQLAAAATAKVAFGLTLSSTIVPVGVGTLGAPGVAIAAATIRSAPWSPLMRIVAVSGGGTSGSSQVQAITFVPVQYRI